MTSRTKLDNLRAIVSPATIVDETEYAPLLVEWRGRWRGTTPLVLAPSTTSELSDILTYTYENDLPVVPQGGNTGLVGGQVPHGDILILTRRMKQIRDVSPNDFSITAEAGVTLSQIQDAASEQGKLFPLSIGSEGSCQLGGFLSTNAGGVNVIRYGNARDLCLGVEALLPDGRIWNGLNRLRKNNVGYDLKHLFIGGEGTIGIITAATLKLFPQAAETVTAFLGVPSASAAVELLSTVQSRSGGQVSSFELMNAATVELVLEHFPDLQRPISTKSPFYCLVELTSGHTGQLAQLAHTLLAQATETGTITDGTIAQSAAQASSLWDLRHRASEAMKKDGALCVKCDVSVPISSIPEFLKTANESVVKNHPGARVIAFGHVGDGNIHYDILGPKDKDDVTWPKLAQTLERSVHDVAAAHGGSISAEHGIGVLKREELAERKDPVEREMMLSIKSTLDPKGLMNPGKLL